MNKRNKWTEDEKQFIKDNYKIMSDDKLSSILQNHTVDSVACMRKRMKCIRNKLKSSFDDVVNAFNKTDYILLSTEEDYKDKATNSLKYLCPKHIDKGIQSISLGHLENGRGCYYCGREKTENAHKIDISNDIESKNVCEEKGFIYVDSERIDGIIYINYMCPRHLNAGIQKMRKNNMKREFINSCPYCIDFKKIILQKVKLK